MNTKILTGHNSFETAYKIENYPWGYKLRTIMYVWIESLPKKGDRVVRQTIDPRTGKLCAAKASTFSNIKALYIAENGHVESTGVNIYTKKENVQKLVEMIGMDNLTMPQLTQYKQMMGEVILRENEFTGVKEKGFSVKWERETLGAGWERNDAGQRVWNKGEKGKYDEVKITFDRPDGVKMIEIFRAMKSLKQERLNEVFEDRPSISAGTRTGVVRICCRGGSYLGEISEAAYKNYLASDANVMEEENA
jgi:uncharacterized protein YlaN (UPF0358 family)